MFLCLLCNQTLLKEVEKDVFCCLIWRTSCSIPFMCQERYPIVTVFCLVFASFLNLKTPLTTLFTDIHIYTYDLTDSHTSHSYYLFLLIPTTYFIFFTINNCGNNLLAFTFPLHFVMANGLDNDNTSSYPTVFSHRNEVLLADQVK